MRGHSLKLPNIKKMQGFIEIEKRAWFGVSDLEESKVESWKEELFKALDFPVAEF